VKASAVTPLKSGAKRKAAADDGKVATGAKKARTDGTTYRNLEPPTTEPALQKYGGGRSETGRQASKVKRGQDNSRGSHASK
jgi:hypothetical protein